jgi:aspartyl-tRNA(Asn)/glutamyl-tRNA(Gln) amidotransferase subunit A
VATAVPHQKGQVDVDENEEVTWLPAWQLRELMAKRELSPVHLLKGILDRWEELQPVFRTMITVDRDVALAAARRSEQMILNREALGPLHGIPISIKDALWTAGMRTTIGSLLFNDFVPPADATPVRRLRDAGAIIFGKANLPEFSGYRRSFNRLIGETLNAWDTTRTSGGSSGGSAVNVALGIGPISIGSDGGGSTRLPASYNGIFGLLPSRGRVPEGPGFYTEPLYGIGPLSRDVRDAAITLQVLAGTDPNSLVSMASKPPDYLATLDQGVDDLRIAWSPDFGRVQPHDQRVLDAVHQVAQIFGDLGATYEEPTLHIEDPYDLMSLDPRHTVDRAMAPYRSTEGFYGLDEFLNELKRDPSKWEQCAIYTKAPFTTEMPTQFEYVKAIPPSVRHRATDHLEDVFRKYDLLLSPTISRTAPLCTEPGVVAWRSSEYARIVNVSGYAAAAVPAGFIAGLPVGLQVMGRPDDEATILRACRALERARPWAHKHPPVAELVRCHHVGAQYQLPNVGVQDQSLFMS